MGAIAKAQQQQVDAKRQGGTFGDYMKQFAPQFKAVMPKGFTPERLIQMAATARQRTPKLAECDMGSFLSCCLQCASLGLEPSAVDGLGRAYIIPRWNGKTRTYEATFQLGKNGMLELVQRSGKVSNLRTQCVYEGDDFDFGEDETGLHFHFKPDFDAEHTTDNLKLVYLSCRLNDGGNVFLYMTKRELDKLRDVNAAKDRSGKVIGPWVTEYEAMCEKSVIRRAFSRGMLPRSVEVAKAITSDETTPIVLDEDGYEVFTKIPEAIPANVDAETGEVVEDAAEEKEEQA